MLGILMHGWYASAIDHACTTIDACLYSRRQGLRGYAGNSNIVRACFPPAPSVLTILLNNAIAYPNFVLILTTMKYAVSLTLVNHLLLTTLRRRSGHTLSIPSETWRRTDAVTIADLRAQLAREDHRRREGETKRREAEENRQAAEASLDALTRRTTRRVFKASSKTPCC